MSTTYNTRTDRARLLDAGWNRDAVTPTRRARERARQLAASMHPLYCLLCHHEWLGELGTPPFCDNCYDSVFDAIRDGNADHRSETVAAFAASTSRKPSTVDRYYRALVKLVGDDLSHFQS